MSRQRFGSWGVQLSEREFANAVAALGTEGGWREPAGRVRGVLTWVLPRRPQIDELLSAYDAGELATRWRTRRPVSQVRLEVEIGSVGGWTLGAEPVWLVRTLKGAEGVSSVVLTIDPVLAPQRRWDWPIDVGYLGDGASTGLRASLQGHGWPEFARHVDAATASAQIDVLLFPGTLAQAVAGFALGPRLAEIHTVLVIGGRGRVRDVVASLGTLRAEANAVAAAMIDLSEVSDGDRRRWLGELLGELAHERSLDEALFVAGHDQVPLVLAPDGALEETRLSVAARDLEHRLKAVASRAAPPVAAARSGTAPAPPIEAIDKLVERTAKLDWSTEHEAAAELVELRSAESALPLRKTGRFVQGRLYHGERALQNEPLVPGAEHRLDVRVGRPDVSWASAGTELSVPELSPGAAGHTLTVVFVAPAVLADPQTATIWLPVHGDSEACSFHFVARDGVAALEGRITVLYENRILQTLRIRAAVGRRSPDRAALSIELESVLRADLEELAGSRGFDAAFFLNDMEGEPGLTAFGPTTAFVKLDSVQALLKALRDELEKITKSPEDYEQPTSEQTRLLLITLARAGAGFGKALRRLPRMEQALAALGDQPGRVQIATIHPDELVPLEFIYDRPFPVPTAELCPGLTGQGGCSDACPRDEHTVCARGFWGLRHVVERRLYNERDTTELQARSADCAIGAEPCQHRQALSSLRSVLIGYAERAANFDKAAFETAIGEIQRSLAGIDAKLIRASSWPTWVTEVANSHPDLLLLITHTEEELGAAVLELGADDHLAAAQVADRHVRAPAPVHPAPGPIVILLGCRTAMKEVPFSDFISAFREARASVVVATISTVRGRHMAPLAREAVELMIECQARASCSVGEYLRDLRNRALAHKLPVGLALVAYGEVDWRIGGNHDPH